MHCAQKGKAGGHIGLALTQAAASAGTWPRARDMVETGFDDTAVVVAAATPGRRARGTVYLERPSLPGVEIEIRPWERLVIRELVEYRLDDWIRQIAFGSRTSGGGIPTMQWSGGVAFSPVPLPSSDAVTAEQVKGVLHWSSVSFAIMEEFKRQIVCDHATINVVDVSANETFGELAAVLKARSRYGGNGAADPGAAAAGG